MAEPFLSNYAQELEILQHLGDNVGSFGSVCLVQHPQFGKVVQKKYRLETFNASDSSDWKKEATKLKQLEHPNIVRMLDATFEHPTISLFYEYMKYGSVDAFVTKFTVSSEWKIQILYDISLGMAYLHTQNPPVIHGNLTYENILIGDGYHAKISDFGFGHKISKQNRSTVSISSLFRLSNHIPPEYPNDQSKTKSEKFDVIGFAIAAWEIFSEKRAHQYFSDRKLDDVFDTGPPLEEISGKAPLAIVSLISDCWQHVAANKPTFESIAVIISSEIAFIRSELERSYASLVEQEQAFALKLMPEVEHSHATLVEHEAQDSALAVELKSELESSKTCLVAQGVQNSAIGDVEREAQASDLQRYKSWLISQLESSLGKPNAQGSASFLTSPILSTSILAIDAMPLLSLFPSLN